MVAAAAAAAAAAVVVALGRLSVVTGGAKWEGEEGVGMQAVSAAGSGPPVLGRLGRGATSVRARAAERPDHLSVCGAACARGRGCERLRDGETPG